MSNNHTRTVKTLHMKVNDDVVQIELHELQPGGRSSPPVWQLGDKQIREVLDLVRDPVHARVHHYYLNHQHRRHGQQQPPSGPPLAKQEIRTGQNLRLAYSFKSKYVKQICLTPTSEGMSGHKVFPQKLVVYIHPLKSLYQQGVLVEQGESHYFSNPGTSNSQQPKLRDMFARKKKNAAHAVHNEAMKVDEEETVQTPKEMGEFTHVPSKCTVALRPITLDDSPVLEQNKTGSTKEIRKEVIKTSDTSQARASRQNAKTGKSMMTGVFDNRTKELLSEAVKKVQKSRHKRSIQESAESVEENTPPQENENVKNSSTMEESEGCTNVSSERKELNDTQMNKGMKTVGDILCEKREKKEKKVKKKKTRAALALMNISLSSEDEQETVDKVRRDVSKSKRQKLSESEMAKAFQDISTNPEHLEGSTEDNTDLTSIHEDPEKESTSMSSKHELVKGRTMKLRNGKGSKLVEQNAGSFKCTADPEYPATDSTLPKNGGETRLIPSETSPNKCKSCPSSSEDDRDLPTLNSLIKTTESAVGDSRNIVSEKIAASGGEILTDEPFALKKTGVKRKLQEKEASKTKQLKLSDILSRKSISEMRQDQTDESWRGKMVLAKENPSTMATSSTETDAQEDVIVIEDEVEELCDEDFEKWFHESCVQQELYKDIEDEEERDRMREIQSAHSPKDLDYEQLSFLLAQNQRNLKNIFRGRQRCERHADYKKGGKDRVNLTYQVPLEGFTDEQADFIVEKLMKVFCKSHTKYLDYVLKVMFPESLVYISTIVKGESYEDMLQGGL